MGICKSLPSCMVALISPYTVTLDQESSFFLSLFNPRTISEYPPSLFCVLSGLATFLSLMDSGTFIFLAVITIAIDLLLHKHVDKWSFVNLVPGDIYSVTKQLLELAPWACFLFRLVISCLHASGPWAASPPMTGGSMKELIYNCN